MEGVAATNNDVDSGFALYFPTERASWAERETLQWRYFLKHPCQHDLNSFSSWLSVKARSGDVPALSLVLQLASQAVMPAGAKGATRNVLRAIVLTSVHVAMSLARLGLAYKRKGWPSWFRAVWKALPLEARHGIVAKDPLLFWSILQAVQRPHAMSSSVYVLFGHSGLYLGKANLARGAQDTPWIPGLASRCVEHMVGLFVAGSRDGTLPRYKALRPAAASVSYLPIQLFDTEARALNVEKILIQALSEAFS